MCVQTGDVFTQLFHEHYPSLLRYAIHLLVSRESAEDIVQDVFMRVWQRQGEVNPALPVKSYLFTITRNAALDALAHEKIVQRHTDTVIAAEPATTSPAADQLVL